MSKSPTPLPAALMGLLLAATPILSSAQKNPSVPYSDDEIDGAVERRLSRDPAIFDYNISAAVKDGVVTLTGTVRNLLEKRRAGRIAASRKGVRTVANTLTVSSEERSAEEITTDVQNALDAIPALADEDIEVNVRDSTVHLSGKVPLFDLKGIAADAAAGVYGVTAVRNDIEMTPFEGNRSDEEIASHIDRRFASDIWLNDLFLTVDVKDGAVTLEGSIGSEDQRTRAVARAWVSGVQSVDASKLAIDDLTMGEMERDPQSAWQVNDESIRQALEDGLGAHPWIVGQNISVSAKDGSVALKGKVNSLAAKEAASRVAANTVGVEEILNQIVVEPNDSFSDDLIGKTLTSALATNPYTRGHKVTPTVTDGVVILKGMMPSSFERHQAAVTAARIRGVREIQNEIKVDEIRRGYHPSELDELMVPFPEPETIAENVPSDAEIKDAIEDELQWSWFVDGSDIDVSVDAGVAKLEGTVPTERSLKAAVRAAADGGAGSIVNELTIADRRQESPRETQE